MKASTPPNGSMHARSLAKRILFPALLFAAAFGGSAHAANVTWTLHNVNWSDGYGWGATGSLTGSFDYNADSNTYTSVNLDSQDPALPRNLPYLGAFTSASSDCPSGYCTASQLYLLRGTGNLTGDYELALAMGGPLTNAGLGWTHWLRQPVNPQIAVR